MADKPRGRGAAFLQKLREVQSASVSQEEPALPSVPSASGISSSGRGRGLQLAKQLEAISAGVSPDAPQTIPQPRGRAALTQKLLELNKLSQLKLESKPEKQIVEEHEETQSEIAKPIKYEGNFTLLILYLLLN